MGRGLGALSRKFGVEPQEELAEDLICKPKKAPVDSPRIDPKNGRTFYRPENPKVYKPPVWLDVGKESHKEGRVCLRLCKSGIATCYNFELDVAERYYLQLTDDFKQCRIVGGSGRKPCPGRKNGHCNINIFQLRKLLPCMMTFKIDPVTLVGVRVEE